MTGPDDTSSYFMPVDAFDVEVLPPKYEAWLNITETELGVLFRQHMTSGSVTYRR